MRTLKRITVDPAVMGGKPCIRGLRMTVGTVVGLVAAGYSKEEILDLYPYLEADDIREALAYAAWRVEEIEVRVDDRAGGTTALTAGSCQQHRRSWVARGIRSGQPAAGEADR